MTTRQRRRLIRFFNTAALRVWLADQAALMVFVIVTYQIIGALTHR